MCVGVCVNESYENEPINAMPSTHIRVVVVSLHIDLFYFDCFLCSFCFWFNFYLFFYFDAFVLS